ncbi:hypothetical protein AMECASPLE_024227, partial [Ameca splendens]
KEYLALTTPGSQSSDCGIGVTFLYTNILAEILNVLQSVDLFTRRNALQLPFRKERLMNQFFCIRECEHRTKLSIRSEKGDFQDVFDTLVIKRLDALPNNCEFKGEKIYFCESCLTWTRLE